MNPLTVAFLLHQFNSPEAGDLRATVDKSATAVMTWLLPNVQTSWILPIVPDGSVVNARYIPPNTTIDIVGNAKDFETHMKRFALVTVAVGAIAGGVAGYYFGKRKK
jgi:hypothetical protein